MFGDFFKIRFFHDKCKYQPNVRAILKELKFTPSVGRLSSIGPPNGLAGLTLGLLNFALPARASGGSGSAGGGGGTTTNTDTIKVSKCEYAVTGGYVELLVNASSSNSNAHLYAFLPDGTYLGEVQNGGGGRYGGTVFGSFYVPDSITIKSSAGGIVTARCLPFQP